MRKALRGNLPFKGVYRAILEESQGVHGVGPPSPSLILRKGDHLERQGSQRWDGP